MRFLAIGVVAVLIAYACKPFILDYFGKKKQSVGVYFWQYGTVF